ncbi:MAG: TraR/DksA family transcriptional regulator [Polyangiaceae bacterium]|nr:TraR/DksA family transcriptional regulator [Polyangiaceae bacterium]
MSSKVARGSHLPAALCSSDRRRLEATLRAERAKIFARLRDHLQTATEDTDALADEMDNASRHEGQALLLRLADQERLRLFEIDRALTKFPEGTYGVCEGTGEPIGLERLELAPWTRFSIEYQEMLEREHTARRRR